MAWQRVCRTGSCNFLSIFFQFFFGFDNFALSQLRVQVACGGGSSKIQKKKKNSKYFFRFFKTELVLAKLLPLILHNLLADRPAPHGAAGGAGGRPPCKRKKMTFEILKKTKTTYYFMYCSC